MIFYPIIIPSGGGSDVVYSYPGWVMMLFIVAFGAILVGFGFALIFMLLDTVFDWDAEVLFKIGTGLILGGAILLLISLPLLIFTGVKVE